LDDRGSISDRGRDFSLRHRIQTVSEALPGSYLRGTGDSFPRRVKQAGREADQSLPSSAEVKNAWSYTSSWLDA